MAVNVVISPVPVVRSAAYHVYVSGLTPTHTVSLNTFKDAFAGVPVTGTTDANGEFASAITAQATLGFYVLSVTDTITNTIVSLTTLNVT